LTWVHSEVQRICSPARGHQPGVALDRAEHRVRLAGAIRPRGVTIHTGVIGGDLDVDIEQGTDTAGAGAKAFDANSKDVTVPNADDNKVYVIEIRAEEFDVNTVRLPERGGNARPLRASSASRFGPGAAVSSCWDGQHDTITD